MSKARTKGEPERGGGANLRFDNVRVLLVDPDRGARDSIRNVLHNNGFRAIEAAGTFARLLAALEEDPGPDLLICEGDLEDGDICEFIHLLRHHGTAFDPFLPVIAITWTPTPELVARVVDAGADDLLVKPLSTDALVQRIYSLAVARRPFVVTSDYVGPDRHRTLGRANHARLLQVPNRLGARSLGVEAGAFQEAVDNAMATVNQEKVASQLARVEDLLQIVLPVLKVRRDNVVVEDELAELAQVVGDAERRSAATPHADVAELCRRLIDVVEPILSGARAATNADIERLTALAKDVQAAHAETAAVALPAELAAADPDAAPDDAPDSPPDAEPDTTPDSVADAAEPRAERRHKFLLRLLTGKISHLINSQTGRRAIIPRPFLQGFDEYLIKLLGEELYEDLNPKAQFLLDRIGSDNDSVIWETIQENEEFWAFSQAILVRILLKFADFRRGRERFMAIVSRAIADARRDLPGRDGRDLFTETHFDIVFATLFSDIFYALAADYGRTQLDTALGAGTAVKLDKIHRAYQRHLAEANERARR